MPLVEKRYAEALVDISVQQGAIDQYQNDLKTVIEQFNKLPEMRFFLLNPEIRNDSKKDFIKKTFGTGIRPEVLNFILLVLDKGRAKHLSGILEEFIKLADKKRSILSLRIVSAAPLDSAQINGIKEKYIRLYNATSANVKTEVEKELLGGVKVIVGDKVTDGSLKGRLEELKQLIVRS